MNTPLLAGWDSIRNNFAEIRLLTEEELQYDQKARPIYSEAQNRFKLFRILELNYKEWKSYQRKLLTPGSLKEDQYLLLDRLMFNFLASAYGLMEHFEVSYRQRYKKNQTKLMEYDSFLTKYCENSWASAFFIDFRNYAQHVALPIGRFSRNESTHSITISITHDAAALIKEYRDWKRSKLSADRGELDLISLTEEYFHRLQRDYGAFMVKCFYPELEEIDAFYWRLTQEVHQQHPSARMVFQMEKEEKKERTKIRVKMSFEQPPNAVFEELGMSIERQT